MLKKVNNKGFAISTMLYGLLIIIVLIMGMILSIMSFNRKNSREFSNKIIDELEEKSSNPLLSAFKYDDDINSGEYCIIGKESTCANTGCIYNDNSNSCLPGTIVIYKVNSSDKKTFYVLHDDGKTMTLIQSENVDNNVKWNNTEEFISKGPIDLINNIEMNTNDWVNVNDQNYEIGKTIFLDNFYTSCSENNCNNNSYSWTLRKAKARAVVYQEVLSLIKNSSSSKIPKWMSNSCDISSNEVCYWLMSSGNENTALYMNNKGEISFDVDSKNKIGGARAVIVINK